MSTHDTAAIHEAAAPYAGVRSPHDRSALLRYGVAVVATAIAVAGAIVIDLPLDVDTNLLLLSAVAISAWYGGRWPGIASALLSAFAISLVFIPNSTIQVAHGIGEIVYVGAFLAVAIVVSGTSETLHKARRASETRVVELQHMTARLETQMEETETLSEHLRESNEALSAALTGAERAAGQALRLQMVTRDLSEARTVEAVTAVLLERGVVSLDAVAGLVATGDARALSSIHAGGDTRALPALPTVESVSNGPLGHALRTRRPVLVVGADGYCANYPNDATRARVPGVGAWLAFALESGGEIVGGIELAFADSFTPSANDVALAGLLAQAAADSLARARSYDEERAGRREAEMQARARAEVLGVVAHDLRNPIHIVVSSNELLLELDPGPEQRHQLIEMSQRAARRMNRLVGDLLDAAQLRAGHLSLDRFDVDAASLLHDAEEAWRGAAADAGVILDAHAEANAGAVFADRDRMLQAIGNLVGNAIKFTPIGGRVSLTALPKDAELEFRVRDTGSGIRAEEMPHLFERFWQADTRDRRGVGLGLAIAKDIIGAHGGSISVQSQPGGGTVFAARLPRGRSIAGTEQRAGDTPSDIVSDASASPS